MYGPDYFRFSNVKLAGDELLFYGEVGPDSERPPASMTLNLDESEVTVHVRQVRVQLVDDKSESTASGQNSLRPAAVAVARNGTRTNCLILLSTELSLSPRFDL